ncbi:MAG: UvrABC system protein C [Lentisphaerae bacterium ADurb.Bin242]|nr:MAG: UvrABC system protein C [Lentisphaerae bacterium ADurb.Bin242]
MSLKKIVFHPGDIPSKPGVYVYRDAFGSVIYVGKASNLRRRMSQYFQPSRENRADPKFRSLVNSIHNWECITVRNEDESLLLESRLIKEYAPKYNILLRDDKRMPLIRIDRSETFPRPRLARIRKDDSCLYFGPFPNGGALRQTLDFLLRYYSLRTCRHPVPGREEYAHCLAGTVRDCCCPCIGKVSPEEYNTRVDALVALLNGNTDEITGLLQTKMREEAERRNFEKAALFRDIAKNIESLYGTKNRTFPKVFLPQAVDGESAVADLQDALLLPAPPRYMICFDNSNISGTLSVASMVVFQNGKPQKNAYRRFRIRTVKGADDFAMMKEIVTRHFSRVLEEKQPLPDLMIVDGGKGQLSSAVDALVALRCPPFPVIGLAKRNEEIFIPGSNDSILLDRSRSALKLLQSIRDESHRFAVTYHRALRLRTIRDSILDEIPCIGDVRKQALLKAFGSVARLRRVSPEEIARRAEGIGLETAKAIADYLKKHPSTGGLDVQ